LRVKGREKPAQEEEELKKWLIAVAPVCSSGALSHDDRPLRRDLLEPRPMSAIPGLAEMTAQVPPVADLSDEELGVLVARARATGWLRSTPRERDALRELAFRPAS
jgi:hypothetical protein